MAVPVEELFHGRVARLFEYPVRTAERVDTATGENEAGVTECLVQNRQVAARCGDAVAEVLRWSCAEFDLTAWLQGQRPAPGKMPGLLSES